MIGIFDSGAGGLSVFREISKLLPEERFIYYSDNANCPYGEKSREYIIDRARAITSFLLEKGADIIVVACNTATAAAISTLRNEFHVSFIGMEPAIKPAAQMTRTGVVGVLATAGTLKATKYIDTREKWSHDIKVVEHIGQGFVELVESGIMTGPEAEEVVRKSVQPLTDAGADTIVLGCTHYPFLAGTIAKVADRPVTLIDPAPAVAKHLFEVMQEQRLIRKEGFEMSLHSSGDISTLKKIYQTL
ncbi:MAG: glutamate racemase [Bacteroidales bacterium]|nr:glutamate racemase [Bacteroidales bacterium]